MMARSIFTTLKYVAKTVDNINKMSIEAEKRQRQGENLENWKIL